MRMIIFALLLAISYAQTETTGQADVTSEPEEIDTIEVVDVTEEIEIIEQPDTIDTPEKPEAPEPEGTSPGLQLPCEKLLPGDCGKRKDCFLDKGECSEAEHEDLLPQGQMQCDKLLAADCQKRNDCFLEKNECKTKEAEDLIPGQTLPPCDKLLPVDCQKRKDCFLEKNECSEAEQGDLIPQGQTQCDKLLAADCSKRQDCFLEKNECKTREAEDLLPGQTLPGGLPCDKLHPADCQKRQDCFLEKNECSTREAEDLLPGQAPPPGILIPQCKFLTPEQCKVTKECSMDPEPPFECELLEIYEKAAEGQLNPDLIAERENENVSPQVKCDDLFPNQCARRPDCTWDYDECKKNKAWKHMTPAQQAAAMAAASASNGGSADTTKPAVNNGASSSSGSTSASCYSLDKSKCTAQSNCFWDEIGCADIGGSLMHVCSAKKKEDCNLTPYCMWDGALCHITDEEVEVELMCERNILPKDCVANPKCDFDYSEGECVSKMEYVAEFELICEGRPHPQCKGACMWKKDECVEHEPMEWETLCTLRPQPECNGMCMWSAKEKECVRDKKETKEAAKNHCFSITDEKKCFEKPGMCSWLSAKCFPADEFNLAKTHEAQRNDKSSNGTYALAGACFFGSCIFGWLIASFYTKKRSKLEDTLLEELNV